MSLLEVRSLSKRFANAGPEVPALDDVSLSVGAGVFSALVGESGSGKTTLLRSVAGLEVPDLGEIHIGGELVFGGSTFVPPEKRGVGLVFQSHALFPHLSVERNIAFGLRRQRPEQRRDRVRELLALTGTAELGERFPHELSGGQRQRIALARALAPRPPLILLDEPFSNLDASLRNRVRDEVRSTLEQEGSTVLFVTHDVEDALAIADRIAVMKDGRLEQEGAPRDIYREPATRHVAGFFGTCNFVPLSCFAGPPPDALKSHTRDGSVWLRPEWLVAGEGQGEMLFEGKVDRAIYAGERQWVKVRLGDSPDSLVVTAAAPGDRRLEMHQPVAVRLKAGTA